jgi:hypothetical protein
LDISVLVYADEDKIMGDNLHTVKRHTEVLFITSAEVDLEKNVGKTKYIFKSRVKNAVQIKNNDS